MVAVVVFVIFALTESINLKTFSEDVGFDSNYVSTLLQNVQKTSENVRTVSDDTVPIVSSAKKEVLRTNWNNTRESIVNASRRLPVVTKEQTMAFLGNTTRLFATIASVNFTSITNLLDDAHDPRTQSTLRERVDHALRSFDYATLGFGQVFDIFSQTMVTNYARPHTKAD